MSDRFFNSSANLALDGGVEKAFPAVVDGEFELRRPVSVGAQDAGTQQDARAERIDLDQEVENRLGFAAADSEHSMRGDGLHRLAILVVHLELFLLVDAVDASAALDDALFEHQVAQPACAARRPR